MPIARDGQNPISADKKKTLLLSHCCGINFKLHSACGHYETSQENVVREHNVKLICAQLRKTSPFDCRSSVLCDSNSILVAFECKFVIHSFH
jgi:hypothetical protein